MEREVKCVSLVDQMRACEQIPGLSVLDHGMMVSDYYTDLIGHLRIGSALKYEWRLPSWINDERLLTALPADSVMETYQVYHDCGKPFCLVVDEEGRRHFPNHASVSRDVWLSTNGDPEVGELIGMDMDVHLLKDEGVAAFARKPQARALLLTALAEIHANASMFGGIDSTSFKIKWKHIEKRGKAILRQPR